jgi:cystathionine beta-lyase/cystathionine gamma-synthase
MDIYTRSVKPVHTPSPSNSVAPPLYQTSVYAFEDIDEVDALLGGTRKGYSYTRGGNPNYDALAEWLAEMEEVEAAVPTGSGTAALLAGILTLLPHPGRILVAREIYGGTVGISRRFLGRLGYRMEWIDTHNLEEVERAVGGDTAVLVVETISNPLGRVCPLDELIPLAHAHGVPVLVDNTFATPFHARPAAWGADLVAHSLTKFIGGHSDLVLGMLAGPRARIAEATSLIDSGGLTPDPFATWLAYRGARTLSLRMERSSQNALALAQHLETLPAVMRVYYPGLASHPDAAHAARLLSRGSGAIVSMSLKGGYEAAQAMVSRLRLVKFVPSLGDVTTTLSHPVVASHRELTAEEKVQVGIDPSVVRISVGLEGIGDILEDFSQALAAGG